MDDLTAEWIKFSDTDLKTAKYLYDNMRPSPMEIICYHCQQSAEKALKGVLINKEITPPKTHDLEKLFAICKEYIPNINAVWRACNILNQYGIQPKYPEEIEITEEDVQEALTCAKDILKFLKPLFPQNK